MSKHLIEQDHTEEISKTSIVNFIPLDKIGQGSFSSVYKVRRITDDQIYALKKIKIAVLKEKQKQNALNQIRILASINSQYIVQYRQAFFDHKLNLLCIVMEFANEGDLQKKIENYRKMGKHIPQNEIWKAAYHTLKGLDVLHNKSILHRDIKSANIFINNGIYKLGDLNVSKVQSSFDELAYTQTGTPYYASPEVWRDQPYDSKSDIWSLGCVLYQMCTYRPPFRGKDLQSLYKNVQKGMYEPLPICYSQQLSDVISTCLRLNPKHRLSAKQLIASNLFKKKCIQLNLAIDYDDYSEQLLKTIKLPNDLKDLKKKLPKSKYSHSIDNISEQKSKINFKQSKNQDIEPPKKYSHADYYLQLARKKKETHNSNHIKLNRVISQGPVDKNPQQNTQMQDSNTHMGQINSCRLISSQRRMQNEIIQQQYTKLKDSKSRQQSTPETNAKKQKTSQEEKKKQVQRQKYKIRIKQRKQYDNSLIKNQLRKLSQDYESPRSKPLLSPISLIKKLSQPASVGKCLSQRNLQSQLNALISKQNQYQTERLLREDRVSKKQIISQKNDELAEIQKKVEEKRKQLRKIGSIHRLQASGNNSKNIHNLSYRPTPLVLNPSIKKSVAHASNILLKSPASTQDQSSHLKLNERVFSHKKLLINPQKAQINKVSSTPYMIGTSDAPRIKRIIQNINQSKRTRPPQLKSRILSSKYLYKY